MSGNKMIKKLLLLFLCIALLSFAGCKRSVIDNSSSHSTTKDTESLSSYKENKTIGTTVDTTVSDGSVNSEHKSSGVSGSVKDIEVSKENSSYNMESSDNNVIIEKDFPESSSSLISNFENQENSTFFDGGIELPDHKWN